MATVENSSLLGKLSADELSELIDSAYRRLKEEEFARSDAVNVALGKIMAKTGRAPEDALLYALTLYDLALDAGHDGQRLVLIDKENRLVREVLGLGRPKARVEIQEPVAG